jgi:CrcB protein
MTVLLVAAGAAVGAPLRYLVDRYVQRRWDPVLPWGTWTVNTLGSLLLGLLAVTAGRNLMLLAGVGFCGAFTTYSTFGHQLVRLGSAADGGRRPGGALLYAALSLAAGLLAALAGTALGELLQRL